MICSAIRWPEGQIFYIQHTGLNLGQSWINCMTSRTELECYNLMEMQNIAWHNGKNDKDDVIQFHTAL